MYATKNIILFIGLLMLSSCIRHKQQLIAKSNSLAINPIQLDAIGQSFLAEHQVLGFSVAMAAGDDIIYHQNYGFVDVAESRPVSDETRFEVASVSKLIGVTVIMKLVELGHLDLQQNLAELLPSFPESGIAEKVKLKHLISNTSGIPDYADAIYDQFLLTGQSPDREDFLVFFDGIELTFQPGNNYQYSNSGFLLMALIAEHVTGKSWQQLINQYINEPVGLDFQLLKHVANEPTTSAIFDINDGNLSAVPTWDFLIGDGGITATSKMLARFASLWSNGRVIQPNLYDEMVGSKKIRTTIPTGYGFAVRNGHFLGEPMIGHTGGWKTTYAVMSYFPRLNVSFAAIMNTDDTSADIMNLFAQYMSLVLNQQTPDLTNQPLTNLKTQQYAGQYTAYDIPYSNQSQTVLIKNSENGPLDYCYSDRCESMQQIATDRFWLSSYPYDYVEFIRNEHNKVVAMSEYHYGFFQVIRLR